MDNQNLNLNLNAKNYQPKYISNQFNQEFTQLPNMQQNYYQPQQQNRNIMSNNDQYANYYYDNSKGFSKSQNNNYSGNYDQQNYYQTQSYQQPIAQTQYSQYPQNYIQQNYNQPSNYQHHDYRQKNYTQNEYDYQQQEYQQQSFHDPQYYNDNKGYKYEKNYKNKFQAQAIDNKFQAQAIDNKFQPQVIDKTIYSAPQDRYNNFKEEKPSIEVIQDSGNSGGYEDDYNKRYGKGNYRGQRGRGYKKGYQNEAKTSYQKPYSHNQYHNAPSENNSQSTDNYSVNNKTKNFNTFEEFEQYNNQDDYNENYGELDENYDDAFQDEFENYGEENILNDDKYVLDEENYDDLKEEFEEKVNVRGSYKKESYSEKNELIFSNKVGFTDYVNKNLNKSKKFPTDSYLNVLMIAEKPSIAQALAFALAKGNAKSHGGRGLKTFKFEGYFKDIKARFTVTSVMGHVFSTDFLSKHNKWDSIDPAELFDVEIIKQESNPKTRLGSHLSSCAKGQDIICLWLDCDKEGENICYETLYYAFPYMNKRHYQQIYRAKFSSLTNNDLVNAFKNISELPNASESLSVDARQMIDLKIGVAFTRFLTSFVFPLIKNIGDPNLKLLSYGPCQTPTLYFCVKRHYEIEKFQIKEYYRPYVEVEISRLRYKIFHGTKFWEKSPVTEMVTKLRPNKQATVTNVEIIKKCKQPPAGLNTVSMLRVASSYLKMSPSDTIHKAEKLYSMGYTTYPRTETTKYASGFDFAKILGEFSTHKQFGTIASKLWKSYTKPHRGVDAGDHPPITPTTKVAAKEDLKGDLWRLYEFICTHFMASLCEGAEYEEKKFTISLDKENFTQDALLLTKEGFLAMMPWKRGNYIKDFPNLNLGQVLKVESVSYEVRETEPPEYLSESDLIKLMEHNRIGTDASMPTHIENITERKYVNVSASRRLSPTKLGIALIEALTAVDSELVLPTVRANIEKNVEEIAKGNKSFEEVLKYTMDLFRNKFAVTRKYYDKLVATFKKYFNLDQNLLLNNIKKINMKNDQFTKSNIKAVDASKVTTDIKPCNYCNKGKLWLEYDQVDKNILRCTNCTIRKKVLRDTIEFEITRNKKCEKCQAYFIFVTVENPFLSGETTYHGCMFCDPNLS